ncbi:MAG: hypothetical protein IPF87_22365 [Gemmatimonadetes bacterium]|nr:hypothetical protein [Gemmatimonadota bacterium]
MYATGELVEKRIAGVAHKPTDEEPVSREVRRLATPDGIKKVAELRDLDESARRKAMERVKANNLVMKLTDAEWRWDRRKLALLHGRQARRFPQPRARVGGDVPDAHRAQADRRARRSQASGRDRALRARVLLGVVAPRAAPGEPWRRQGPEALAQPDADFRGLRAPDVLPPLRARLLRAAAQALSQRRKDHRDVEGGGEGRLQRHLPRARHVARPEGDMRILPLAELRREWRNPPAGTQVLEEDTSPYPYEQVTDEVLRLQDTSEMPVGRPDMAGGA